MALHAHFRFRIVMEGMVGKWEKKETKHHKDFVSNFDKIRARKDLFTWRIYFPCVYCSKDSVHSSHVTSYMDVRTSSCSTHAHSCHIWNIVCSSHCQTNIFHVRTGCLEGWARVYSSSGNIWSGSTCNARREICTRQLIAFKSPRNINKPIKHKGFINKAVLFS